MSLFFADNESFEAAATFNWKGRIEYNQFIDRHQRLRSERQANINVSFVPRKILFADGSTKNYGEH
jgi:hypothetical protein